MKLFFLPTRLFNLFFVVIISLSSSYAQFSDIKNLSFINSCASIHPISYGDGRITLFYSSDNLGMDTLFMTKSTDNGINWSEPNVILTFPKMSYSEEINVSAAYTDSNKLVVVYSIYSYETGAKPVETIISDDNGETWSQPKALYGSITFPDPVLKNIEGILYVSGRVTYVFKSSDEGVTWEPIKTAGFKAEDLVSIGKDSLLAVCIYNQQLVFRSSTDAGKTWSQEQSLFTDELPVGRPRMVKTGDGSILLLYTVSKNSATAKEQFDIVYRKSTDKGLNWSEKQSFTKYAGDDSEFNASEYEAGKAFVVYISERWNGNKPFAGVTDVSADTNTPPVIYEYHTSPQEAGVPLTLYVTAVDEKGIASVTADVKLNGSPLGTVELTHSGDDVYSGELGTFQNLSFVEYILTIKDVDGNEITYDFDLIVQSDSLKTNWLSAGSLHNWYSSIGCEYEEGLVREQQYGMQWPAIYQLQDLQVAKALWIGTKDFVDESGQSGSSILYPYKVVHVGPRVKGTGEFFPKRFDLTSKYPPSEVYVNGALSTRDRSKITGFDPQFSADQVITNVVNTQTGITMTRRIMQWSQEFNDNYHIAEYTFKNTGNVDADDEIELPAKTLDSVYFYFQYRLASNSNTRYAIGNGTGWGMNTMIDTRGDGRLDADNPDNLRFQYIWHGPFPPFTLYDNLGGPLWTSAHNVEPQDTIGRLGAPQFAGVLTIHADKSASDKNDDSAQPSTTSYEGSDEPLTTGNSAFNTDKMKMEFAWMKRGHKYPRHAEAVDPDGDYATANGDPAIKTPGGFTIANGYGPYHLAPGDSITIVLAEAVAGLSREKCIEYGRDYKREFMSAGNDVNKKIAANYKKNLRVMSGKDSLFQTFRRAAANYQSSYNIPLPPAPPKKFSVYISPQGTSVEMTWEAENDADLKGFEIWRAEGRFDTSYTKVFETSNISIRTFTDSLTAGGVSYFYYLLSVGEEIAADPSLGIPKKKLTSSRYYTQTYDPVSRLTDVADDMNQYKYELQQNYPNPFNPSTTISFSIPERQQVVLKVFNMLGEEIETLINNELNAGHHKFNWNAKGLTTGVYIYALSAGTFRSSKKLLLMK